MTRTPAEMLLAAGAAHVVHEHAPVATVAEIVAMLPFPASDHVKTLAVTANGSLALAALRGHDRLQFGKLARALGVARDRIAPLPPERVRAELGQEPGGVCPFVDRDDVRVLVDRGILALDRCFCGSGRSDASIELATADLVAVARAEVVDLAAERSP